jgi:hypothetical protein
MRRSISLALVLSLCIGLAWWSAGRPGGAPQPVRVTAAGDPDTPDNADVDRISPLETRVLGQSSWLRGGPGALRVIVTDHNTGKPVHAQVAADLYFDKPTVGNPFHLFTGPTDRLGTVDAQFHVPSFPPGAYLLKVKVRSPLGPDEVDQQIRIQDSMQLMLTSDKPLYQPGQMMHIRALALDMATRTAPAGKPIVFEIEDARGNKVFKKSDTLSRFGVASADFELADEVNMGVFTLRAILGDAQTEKKVTVQRYVLPKFKLAVSAEKPWYLPGDLLKGTVEANYFFGKPVGGSVSVTINTVDIGVTKLDELKGRTDADGKYRFEYRLPAAFVGQPFEQGRAVVELAASVTDTADQKQEANSSIPVVKSPVLISAIPETRALVPNVPNRLYIAAGTPDGQPLKQARVEVAAQGEPARKQLTTDELGVATYEFTPKGAAEAVTATVTDSAGHSATVTQNLAAAPGQEAVLLRSDRTLAKVGERLALTVLCSHKTGTVYLDVIRNKQTILTRAESCENGRAEFLLPLSHDMAGTLELHAYKILPDENIVRDTRTIVVAPADDLKISAAADKGQYRPGDDATIRFLVVDSQQRPVTAALGLAVVDESVFALSELQPGLEKIYFTLERELMEPKYEIHGLRPTFLMEQHPPSPARDFGVQRAAAMLLCSAPAQTGFDFRVDTYTTRWQKLREKVEEEMMRAYSKTLDALSRYQNDTHTMLKSDEPLKELVRLGYLNEQDLKDHWGRAYRFKPFGGQYWQYGFQIASAGPDGKWGTNDDISNTDEMIVRRRGVRGRMGGFGGGGNQFREFEMGVAEDRVMRVPMAMAAPMAGGRFLAEHEAVAKAGLSVDLKSTNGPAGGGAAEPRVRQYFPETMYWNPELITDDRGRAELKLPLADSITTWRMSMIANSAAGQLGSATTGIKVFQDFFADIDLPVSLTQNDRIEIPVAVYNYLPHGQKVTLTLKEEPWFSLQGPAQQTIEMGKGDVKVVHYPIVVKSIGKFALQVTARGATLSDAIRRTIDVLPDGKEVRNTINDQLNGAAQKTVSIPEQAVPGGSNCWLKLYPGTFSTVVEGMDGILRMPYGCFEQTSSSTYPNVLALDYLKATKRVNPEIQMKAEGFINVGYQRLVTFECKSGGFSWFGNEPAHQVLTAYGLLEFSDMARVHDVDPALIARTQRWLAGKQQADGTWEEKGQGIAEGIINRQTGALRTTAYVSWALADSGFKGPQLERGVDYVKQHIGEADDPYTLAVMVNLLATVDKDGASTTEAAEKLIKLAKTTEKTAWWEGKTETFTGARGEGADIETTGLAACGLARWGRNFGFTNKVLTYLVQTRDSYGTWQSTQGTVWAMKALLYASRNGVGGTKGAVTVLADGKQAATVEITAQNSDVMRQIDLSKLVHTGANAISLELKGEGNLLYQIVERHYLPWKLVRPPMPHMAPLTLDVSYDKTTLARDDEATVTVKIHNQTDFIAEMPLIDVGVPPGFTVIPDRLDALVKEKTISKYTIAARQVIVYLEKLDAGHTTTVTYKIRARFPIKARTPLSQAYPYYDPKRVATSAPQDIVVK